MSETKNNDYLRVKSDAIENVNRYYCVAILNISNQREMIGKVESLPISISEWQEFDKQVIREIGPTFRLRKLFLKLFDAYSTQRFSQKDYDLPILELYKKVERTLRRYLPKLKVFADTVIIYVPLSDSKREIYADGLFRTLLSIAGTYIQLMAGGYIIRGGLDVGVGIEVEQDEIYGPVVLKAYNLESKIAKYPRVVLGENFAKFLKLLTSDYSNSDHAKYNKAISVKCSELLFEDGDGSYALDYLGIAFRDFAGATMIKYIDKAKWFVNQQIGEAKSKRQTELFLGYHRLQDYFEYQMPYWDDLK